MIKRLAVCSLFLLGFYGEKNADAALYAISGAGTTTEMGTVDKGGVFFSSTFTFQIIYDDSVTPLVYIGGSRTSVLIEDAITSFIVDGQEQVDPFSSVGSQISMSNEASPAFNDSLNGFIDNASLTIDGAFGDFFTGTPGLQDLSAAFNLGTTDIYRFYRDDFGLPMRVSGRITSASAPVLVPEPSAVIFGLVGLIGLLSIRRRPFWA